MLNNHWQCWLLPLGGAKDEGEDAQDLRRTESDSILKKVSVSLSVCCHRVQIWRESQFQSWKSLNFLTIRCILISQNKAKLEVCSQNYFAVAKILTWRSLQISCIPLWHRLSTICLQISWSMCLIMHHYWNAKVNYNLTPILAMDWCII